MKQIITIDGPAAAGKSTIAKKLSALLGYVYIDTGAMYRAVALQCIRKGISFACEDDCTKVAANSQIQLHPSADGCLVYLDGENVTEEIRMPIVAQGASKVSAIAGVRQVLVSKQRQLAENGKVIMDGRDIGTVVLPQADCKIFMTATLACRAKRRYLELLEKGEDVTLAEVTAEMEQRDYRDSHRNCSPLRRACDAIYLDTSMQNIEEVLEQVLTIVQSEN